MKKVALLCLTSVLALSLTGCGSNQNLQDKPKERWTQNYHCA